MRRLLFVLGTTLGTGLFAIACGDDGDSEMASGGRGGGAEAGEASGGASGKGGTSSGGSATGGKSGSGGTATGGRASGGASGSAPTGGNGTGGDGGNNGGAGSPSGGSPAGGEGGSVVVGNPPVATINHPGDGEMRNVNVDIPFVGVGDDPEDGMLSGAALVWTSNREGQIGTGQTFNAPLAQTGMQVITLTVTDSDGNQATDSITLDMR